MLNFVGFINDNSTLTGPEGAEMLQDFCEAFGYTDDTGRVEFANARITNYIKSAASRARKNRVEVPELVLEDGTVVLP